ncbi:hypothetical protein NECAME_03944 [Necator americanus]|uniref:Uncharacterized protein n=1 Tax=Necator americanus TaxID=51031 RepID=W2T0R0_NECAM|nr:hypothetical protein NECAME_03944 [Necator americanus]ETN74811.1 hypothetical protein NECAME_03944 [Necator americanus]
MTVDGVEGICSMLTTFEDHGMLNGTQRRRHFARSISSRIFNDTRNLLIIIDREQTERVQLFGYLVQAPVIISGNPPLGDPTHPSSVDIPFLSSSGFGLNIHFLLPLLYNLLEASRRTSASQSSSSRSLVAGNRVATWEPLRYSLDEFFNSKLMEAKTLPSANKQLLVESLKRYEDRMELRIPDRKEWTFLNSFNYAYGLILTLGHGTKTPETTGGQKEGCKFAHGTN